VDKDKLADLLAQALDEVEEDTDGLERLSGAIERLANAIENSRPYWYASYGSTPITWTTVSADTPIITGKVDYPT
jgi:hypothetical protein